MKKIPARAAVLALLVAAAGSISAQGAKPNFSGTWNLDLPKSDFGPSPPPTSIVLVVVHKDPAVKVSSTQKSDQGTILNERNLTTDGKPNPNKIRSVDGEQDVTSTSKWVANKLVTSYQIQMQGMALDLIDTWELSADGKVLTIVRDVKTPQGDFSLKTVYNKQ